MAGVVLGLSGGVDSSVAAYLLREAGHTVFGVYLDNGLPGREAAQTAADALEISLAVLDMTEMMEENVCRPFAEGYLRGETPNPCILCNPAVKFRLLLREADRLGAEYVATGHYAVSRDGALFRGRPENDQSYMLCRLESGQVRRLLLPLGPYSKAQVRVMAQKLALPPADKPDSMEICFIPDGDHAAWIEKRGVVPPPGEFILDGVPVGTHKGIHHYTVGQRKHFGTGFGKRVYVSEIRPETNQVILSSDDGAVWRREFRVSDLHWISAPDVLPLICSVRVRHSRAPMPSAVVYPEGEGAIVRMAEPIRAPAPGQSAAFYVGDQLMGGGFISK